MGMASLIFFILGIIALFYKMYVGIILTIIAFALSLSYRKRDTLAKTVLVASIIALSVETVLIVVAYKAVEKSHKKADTTLRKIEESHLETSSWEFIESSLFSGTLKLNGNTLILTKKDYDFDTDCEWYVIYDKNKTSLKTDAYLKCDDYTTEGFDDKNLK